MMCRLLVSVGILQERRLSEGEVEEGNANRQPVLCETGRNRHRRRIDEERVQTGSALFIHVWRVDTVLDERRRMFDRLEDNRIELIVRNHLLDVEFQLVAS